MFRSYPFSMLSRLKEIPQSPKHHPEGNVWNHTMLVVDEAARQKSRSKDPAAFMWAALLHDVGKADTTDSSKGRITAYNHEKAGAAQAEIFLKDFLDDHDLIRRIVSLIRWHMQILFVVKSMQFADIKGMLKEAEAEEVALLGYCDRMGRLGADAQAEQENVKIFLAKCLDFITRSR
jgi:putative nucleotidyltransferase with HDIG domain